MTAFRLERQLTPEERLVAKLRDWAPADGYGNLVVRLEYENGALKHVVKLSGEDSAKLG